MKSWTQLNLMKTINFVLLLVFLSYLEKVPFLQIRRFVHKSILPPVHNTGNPLATSEGMFRH